MLWHRSSIVVLICALSTRKSSSLSFSHLHSVLRCRTTFPLFAAMGDDAAPVGGGGASTSAVTADIVNIGARPDLPDYGQTPIEIDKIQLVAAKWRRRDLFGNSLVDQTVKDMEVARRTEVDNASEVPLSKEDRLARRRTLAELDIPNFMSLVQERLDVRRTHDEADDVDVLVSDDSTAVQLLRRAPTVLQINVGLYCNQACGHCHVESSPLRTEMMTAETAARCLHLLAVTPSITTLDITGGAPELNASFRTLVATARHLRPDIQIIDRCNLTVLQEPGQEDLIDFLKLHQVSIVASLPCYSQKNVDQSRGSGVFERSLAALLALNDAGYGTSSSSTATTVCTDNSSSSNNDNDNGTGETTSHSHSSRLTLDLVYNPSGAFLPPPQDKLQAQYKEQLATNFGILFDSLYTMTNMPVKRFVDFLQRRDELADYMSLLVRNFNPDTVSSLMCRDTISVGYDGRLYDCDFNQQLGLGLGGGANGGGESSEAGLTIFDVEQLGQLRDYEIRTDRHCFGCTAGMGSS